MSDENQKSCFGNFEKIVFRDNISVIMKKNIIISILIVAVAIIAIIFVSVTNNKPSEVAPIKEEVATEIPKKIEGWQTYRSEKNGFEVQYPKGWEFDGARHESPVGFGPSGLDDQYQRRFPKIWFVSVYDSEKLRDTPSARFLDLLKKDSIEQYAENERRISDGSKLFKSHEDRRFVFIDGYKGVLVKEAVDEFGDWVLVSIHIEKNGKIFVLTDISSAYVNYEAMYGSLEENFQDFYESFHFID